MAAAFGAIGALLLLAVTPITVLLAATFPPAYALAAGVHSILPYLARRLLALPFAATLVALIVGVLSSASTPLGVLVIVSLLAGALPFDVTLALFARVRGRLRRFDWVLAAAASAVVLFLVSLPVFSPEHVTPFILIGAFVGRLLGQLGALGIAWLIAERVWRAGIRRRSDAV